MNTKFKSRKFWITIGTAVSLVVAQIFEIEVDPAAIAGLAAIIGTYVFSQGLVDKQVVSTQVAVAGDIGRAQLEQYARSLEGQLKVVSEDLETIVEASTLINPTP